ncbi:MAG: O-acetyl-ADP-ribose deacetylase [Coxiella sp. (in: Bacteria)]|nr:MAG: O-acetyl-ADP-ribose deacetylase [Coxiella sp. (in: g-proteobacteria)]
MGHIKTGFRARCCFITLSIFRSSRQSTYWRSKISTQPDITIIQDDITQLAVDAVVNAANTSLLGGGGVDGAIHRAAGPELLEACRLLNGCDTGQAKLTAGFKLPAKYIIHTVGPVWHGGDNNESELLASCYRECLNLTLSHDIKSIAFPAISCGVYHFPAEQAIAIAFTEVKRFLSSTNHLDAVQFVCFDDAMKTAYTSYQKGLT